MLILAVLLVPTPPTGSRPRYWPPIRISFVLLFDGALKALQLAKLALSQQQIAAKGKYIGKAISIVDEGLRAALNYDQGGDIARNLGDLYQYIAQRLLEANLHNDVARLDECSRLLESLREAWVSIGKPSAVAAEPPPPPADAARRTPMSYGKA